MDNQRTLHTTVVIDWENLAGCFSAALQKLLDENPGYTPILDAVIELVFFVGTELWGGPHLMEIKASEVFGSFHRMELFERALNLQATLLYREKNGKGPPFHYMRDLEVNGLQRPTLARVSLKVSRT